MRILDSIKDPGPCPEVPGDKEPINPAERVKWRKQMWEYGDWLDKSRRFQLATKVKLLEEIPEEKRTLVESIVFIMAMDVLANDLQSETDIFKMLHL